MFTILVIITYILLILFCVVLITSSIQNIIKNHNENTGRNDFMDGYETAQMINTSKDQLIQFMKHQGQRNIHYFIVDELPDISEAEVGAVYITVDWIADDSIAYYQYYTVVGDMWVTVDENVDMGEYL